MRARAAVVLAIVTLSLLVSNHADAALPLVGVDCGEFVNESIRLKANLECSAGQDGIVIAEDGITIDLNGHLVRGGGGASDFGILNAAGFDRITVTNGSLTGWDEAVHLETTLDSTLSRLTVSRNVSSGVFLENSDGNVIRRNLITDNGGDGIQLDSSGSNRISGNRVHANTANGVRIDSNSHNNRLRRNDLSSNLGSGVGSTNSDENVITENTMIANDDDGAIIGGERNVIADNIVRGNRLGGITVASTSEENRVVRNVVKGNDDNGILVGSGSLDNVIRDNTVLENRRDGIKDDAGTSTIRNNRSHRNGFIDGITTNGAKDNLDNGVGLGISGEVTTVGSGNVAKGNRDLDECLPASLC